MTARVRAYGPRPIRAQLQLALLRSYCRLSSGFGWRGLGTLSAVLGRIFGRENRAQLKLGNRLDPNSPHGEVELQIELDDYYWTRLLDPGFRYEPELAWVLARLLRPGTDFVDCGANIGYWTLLARATLPAEDRVIAVEAAPEMADRLQRNIELNPRLASIACIQAAVDDGQLEQQYLHFRRRHHAAATVNARGWLPAADDVDRIAVPTVSLDALLAESTNPKFCVVKLDIEGSELPALRASQQLDDPRIAIIYEDHGSQRDRSQSICHHLLAERGFQVAWLHAQGCTAMPNVAAAEATKTDPRIGYNFVAALPQSPLWRHLEAVQ